MKALIQGKHYNQAWMVHEALGEAISRLFINRYIPPSYMKFIEITDATETNSVDSILQNEDFKKFSEYHSQKMSDRLSGKLGKTAQFWLLYVHFIDILQKFHYAIQTNDFDAKLESWKSRLPLFFFFNCTHYSRYGSHYIKSLELLDKTHPGAREEIMNIGISVRRNDKRIGQAIDLAGEQSYMRSAKTAGVDRFSN